VDADGSGHARDRVRALINGLAGSREGTGGDATVVDPASTASIAALLASASAPVLKLIDTVAVGVGGLAKPWQIRRVAQAEADAQTFKAMGETRAARIRAEGDAEIAALRARMAARLESQELRRQQNIEAITMKAASQLPPVVSSGPVDGDWTAQFLARAQDVGNEEMQKLWAQILAGEVARPGTYSLRTLRVLHVMRQSEAMLFRRLCDLLWLTEDESVFVYPSPPRDTLEQVGMPDISLRCLESLGLLHASALTQVVVGRPEIWVYSAKRHLLTKRNRATFLFWARILSDIGGELASLVTPQPDEMYRSAVVQTWQEGSIEVQVDELEAREGDRPDET
jgi:hypothetical protein